MSSRTKAFISITAAFGAISMVSAAFVWQCPDPGLFLLYLTLAVLCSCFQLKSAGGGAILSANLPVILLSMVQLSRPEVMAIGCTAALVQSLWNPQTRSRLSQVALSVSLLATIIATANFVRDSLLPGSLKSETVHLAVACLALFFANTFPGAIILRLERDKRLGRVWKEQYFWSFPYYLIAAATANVFRTALRSFSFDAALLLLAVLYVAHRYHRVQKSRRDEKHKYAGEVASLHVRAIEALALAVEAKDQLNTHGHLRRVQVYALGVGRELGLSRTELEALRAAALLHDIGKMAVPDHILTKPGKLTAEEFAKIKVHPLVGAEIVEQVQFPYPVAPIVRSHHEKWDGSGYPVGLKGEEIPLGARILTAADCLDALTSDREYRRGLPLDDAMRQLVSESGRSFDPAVIRVLERRYRDLDLQARANADPGSLLSTGARVERGRAPDAGLDLSGAADFEAGGKSFDFLGTIAAARREEKLVLDMARGVGGSLDLEVTLKQVEDNLRQTIPFDALAIFLLEGNTLAVEHASGDNDEMLHALRVPAGEGLAGWVAENARPVVNGNPAVDPGFRCAPDKTLDAALVLPLEGAGGLLGVMALYRRDKDAFTRDDLRILLAIVPRIGSAIDNARKYRELELRADLDGLTGLPNARLMMRAIESELARARRQKQHLGVAVAKLSGSGPVEQLLPPVAQGIKSSCREYDHVARLGEDRFGLVLPGMRPDHLGGKTLALDAAVATAAVRAGNPGLACLAVGAAFYPDDADSAKSLLAIAERRAEQHLTRQAEDLLALEAQTGSREAEKQLAGE
ncbi:MAG: HD domain-containing protein [Acidobacteria bacterium]|nr:HD domain-containing protein [Acidobacteriota bacterium]